MLLWSCIGIALGGNHALVIVHRECTRDTHALVTCIGSALVGTHAPVIVHQERTSGHSCAGGVHQECTQGHSCTCGCASGMCSYAF